MCFVVSNDASYILELNMEFFEISELLEEHFNFDYVEYEGADLIRHDLGDNSFWINKDCSFENLNTFPKAIQNKIAKLIA